MHYYYNYVFGELESVPTITEEDDHFVLFPKDVPCWSLVALLDVIPQELFDGEYIINITEGVNHKWVISYEAFCGVSSYAVNTSGDNLIDCCVEMIIKLKERNLI
jgi:hypothetical protein